jgi:HEAT repeats
VNENSDATVTESRNFGYKIRLARTFQEVLDETTDVPGVDLAEFAQVVRRYACTLLQARGGAGKTCTAKRLGILLEGQGAPSVIVTALALAQEKSLDRLGAEHWSRLNPDDETVMTNPSLIVIDGLNEVDRETGERILEAIGPYTATNPQTSVLVTDRLARRNGASPFWMYATLLPVPDDVIREITGEEPTDAYGIPFYLDRHEEGRAAGKILYESIRRYVSADQLPRLATAAYLSYEEHKKRTIDRDTVIKAVGPAVWEEMIDGKAVVQVGPTDFGPTDFYFEHHLLHDYLAGHHLATHRDLWNPDGFDVVTFNASSFDALALSLAEIESPEDVEELVQCVYNWNFYAAAYMLEEDRAGGREIGNPMETALLGALAEKRFDYVRPTVTRVEDALRVQRSTLSRALLDAHDRDAVVAVLSSVAEPTDGPEWFTLWWDQYSRPDGTRATREDVEAVAADVPVVGWGAANALRRLRLTKPELSELRQLLLKDDASGTVRWRAAHALGTHPGGTNRDALRTALRDDKDRWVRYGALRAIFEHIREAKPSRRPDLVEQLKDDVADELAGPGQLRTEAIRCLDVAPLPPGNWHADIEPILAFLWETADAKGSTELANLAERLRRQKDDPHVA